MRVLREFWPGALPEDEKEALGEFGVVENPQYIYVAGPVRLDCLDLGAVGSDVGLPAGLVERCVVESVEADWVLTVENLTSFYQVVGALPARTVVLYLGGYHNRVRRRFLVKLAEARPGLRLEPWLMDVGTYVGHWESGMECGEGYRQELEGLLGVGEFEVFWPVVREMLERGRRVEQESVGFWWGE